MRTIQDMISMEVRYCVSGLVSTLAASAGMVEINAASRDAAELAEQAIELVSPIPDYEEAAIQSGAELDDHGWRSDTGGNEFGFSSRREAAEDFCDTYHIEPYERQVFEHWIVTDWLADKLAAEGEKVDKDFAGLTIWARTTTGQAIYADGVVERIYAETHTASE